MFWKHKTMLLQFLSYHTKSISCIWSICRCYMINYFAWGKRENMKEPFPFCLCIASTCSPPPSHSLFWGCVILFCYLWKKKNLCSFCSINITGRNCIYPKDVMYIICLLLPLLVIWPYRWPLARLVAIISRAMAYAGKYLDLLLEF